MSYECCKRITLDEKNNKIKVCCASNNLRPLYYETYELFRSKSYKDFTFDDKLLYLFYDLLCGNIQVTNINDNTEKFEYALCKAREYLSKNNLNEHDDLFLKVGEVCKEYVSKYIGFEYNKEDDHDYWQKYRAWEKTQVQEYANEVHDKLWKQALKEVYGKSFEVFKKALKENIEGNYKVVFNDLYVVTKLGKFNRGYSSFTYANRTYYDFINNKEEENNRFEKLSYKRAYIFCKDLSNGRKLEMVKI